MEDDPEYTMDCNVLHLDKGRHIKYVINWNSHTAAEDPSESSFEEHHTLSVFIGENSERNTLKATITTLMQTIANRNEEVRSTMRCNLKLTNNHCDKAS